MGTGVIHTNGRSVDVSGRADNKAAKRSAALANVTAEQHSYKH